MSVFKKLGEGIADLSELNVQTFTGSITSVIDDTAEGSVIDWQKLMAQAKTSGAVKLAASTKVKFDGDADAYFASDITPELMEAHLQAVEAGQSIREGLVDMFRDIIGIG